MFSLAHVINFAEYGHIFGTYQVFSTLCIALLTAIFSKVLKYTSFRRKYSRLLPGAKFGLLDIYGNFSTYRPVEQKTTGLSFNVMLFQTATAYCQLHPDKQLVCFWLSYFPLIFIKKAEATEALLSGTKYLQKGWYYKTFHPWLGTGLLTSHGSKWKFRRNLLKSAFHSDVLKSFFPIFNKHAQVFIKLLQEETTKESTDIVMPIALCSLDIICETMLGVTVHAQENRESQYVNSVERASDILMKRLGNPLNWADFFFNFTKAGKELKEHVKILHDFSRSVIQEKKKKLLIGDQKTDSKKKRKALIDILLEEHMNSKDFTEEDIREEIDTFAFEGHDTLLVGISWALYLIGLHKDIQEKVHDEMDSIFGNDVGRPANTQDLSDMKYLDCVLKESQRLYPSVPFIAREITENTNICGYPIPKGSSCVVHIHNLHRDERWFPNPEKFDPDRFRPENCKNRHPYAFIPFSVGPRNCIGQRFAQMELKIIVSAVLRNFTLESLDQRDKLPPSSELILKSPLPIRIRIRQRQNLFSKQT